MNALNRIKKWLQAVRKKLDDTTVIAVAGVFFLFSLAMVIQFVTGGVAFLTGFTDSIFEPFTLSLVLILLACVACIAGSLSSGSDVNKGGAVVAKRLGAVQASARSDQSDERALIKTVADTAIAFGSALPSVHVLREEDGINSFVVGSLSGNTAIVFTKGALRNLTEGELLAMAAHEFSHIANKDVPRNMKLMVAFGGFLALDQYGRMLAEYQYQSLFLQPIKFIGYGLIALGFVGVGFAYVLRTLFTRRTEMAADKSAVSVLKRTRSLCSVLSKIKHSAKSDSALSASYVDEIRHVCFHAGSGELWRTRFNSSHPTILTRLKHVDYSTAAIYASTTASSLMDASGSVALGTAPKANSSHTSAISKAASDAARSLGVEAEELRHTPISDKLAMAIQDPVSSLAALFSLFLPDDKDEHSGYLSAVAFAYNQNFADTVLHLNEIINREIKVERLSVAKHATEQLKSKLDPDASRRVLLNLERLLKAQNAHNLMNYSAIQYIRHELSADFPVLTKTADINKPNAEGRKAKLLDKMGLEFSKLISLVIDSTDLDAATADKEYQRVMATYPNADYPRWDEKDITDTNEIEVAYQLLLMQPRAIREKFVQHCSDIFDLDKEDRQPKSSRLDLLCASLGSANKQSQRWELAGFERRIA